jgi:heat shock protein HtpX
VAVTAGLLRQLNPRELAGVLAHEISHIRHRDLFVMSLADAFSRVTAFLGQAGQLLILLSLPAWLAGMAFPWLGALVLLLAPVASALLQLALSRAREHDADVGAVQLTGDPMGLVSALVKLQEKQGRWLDKVLRPGRGDTQPALLRTHPHTQDRIARLRGIAADLASSTVPTPDLLSAVGVTPPRRQPRWHRSGLWY